MSRAAVIFLSILLCAIFASGVYIQPTLPSESIGYVGPELSETKILFVGDVMLARYVETLMNQHGSRYPFLGLEPLMGRYDYVIGNFEAPIPKIHEPTQPEEFSFSVSSSSVKSLGEYFDYLSLANNHTFDKGQSGIDNTRAVLATNGVTGVGDPNDVSSSSVTYLDHDGYRIAVITLNGTGLLNEETVVELLNNEETVSEMQIVYIHWGEEYERTHSPEQERLAQIFIDNGADAIIGHHPHVVQDIGVYRGAPIFYSIGNFVFDQYFSDDVQTGVGVELAFVNQSLLYRLVPFTTKGHESSPRLMSFSDRQIFLDELAKRSSPLLSDDIAKNGIVVTISGLASL